MDFLYVQLIIFCTIILSSVIGGKKGALISLLVWAVESYSTYKIGSFNYIQIIILGFSFQIAVIIAIIRDVVLRQLKKQSK